MPYVGGRIASLFRPEPTRAALERMADRGGDRLHDLAVENTPIGGREGPGRGGGNLRSSWYRDPPAGGDRKRRGPFTVYEARVATDVDYAPHVEWGTGLWGPSGSPYVIEPRPPNRFLRWIDPRTGQEVFRRRVLHPGSPGQHMMAIAVGALEREIEAGLFDGILADWRRQHEALAD